MLGISINTEPILVGTLITLLTSSILFLVSKSVQTVNHINKISNHQIIINKSISDVQNKQNVFHDKLETLSTEFINHMKGEENVVSDILEEIKRLGFRIDAQSLAVAITAFRQAAFHSKDAFYITLAADDGWDFIWGNDAYYKMSGLTLLEARAELYYHKNVDPKDLVRVMKIIEEQTSRSEDVDFNFNYIFADNSVGCVRLSAIPVLDSAGNAVAYFGAIKVISDGPC